jgi:membrane-associated phospholipid phosphatase
MTSPPTPSAPDHRASWRFVVALVATAAVMALLPTVDHWAWQYVRMDGVYNRDWGRLLRVAGFAPAWILGAVAIMLSRSGRAAAIGWRNALMPGWFLLGSIAATGLIGELVKLVVRRERPGPHDGLYAYLPWTGDWSTGAIGFPSTHAIVAFAGALALARLSPRSGPVWIAIACGCGLTRLLDGKHFASDVLAAGVLAWVIVALLDEVLRPDRLEPR